MFFTYVRFIKKNVIFFDCKITENIYKYIKWDFLIIVKDKLNEV